LRKLLYLAFLLPSLLSAQLTSGVLAPARSPAGGDWSSSGISGGIPSAGWSQCGGSGGTIAPYGSSGSPASPATITNAISTYTGTNCYVLLGNGDFYLNSCIHLSGKQGIELRGGGPQNTRLHFSGTCVGIGGFGNVLADFSSSDTTYAGGSPTAYNWTAGYSQGATSITLASTTGIVVGTMLIADQYDDGCAGGSCSNCSTPADNGNYFNCQAKYIPAGAVCNSGTGATTPIALGCSENGSNNAARPNRGDRKSVV
jgi:hypothetical protein